jgi:hypothetical protein
MRKEKVCYICQGFKNKNYIPEMILHINKMIKSKETTEKLNKETGFDFTDYRYKLHREQCLINFEIPKKEQEIKLKKDIEITENSNDFSIDIKQIVEEYRNMSIEDKINSHLKNLDEIKYLTGYITNYNLINGYTYKGFIPKEDINSLKIINDMVENNINETFKFSFVGKNSQEIFNSSFEAFSQGKLTLKQMDDISKLALAKMRIENYNKEDKNFVFEQEKESEEQLMDKIYTIRKVLEHHEKQNKEKL